jgi:hypothetical protein
MESKSIHDHRIRELSIDAVERTIRMRTGYPELTGPEFAEVVFTSVEAYVFSGDALGTILFDIELIDPLTLYCEYAEELQLEWSKGGHAPWVTSESSAAAFLSSRRVRGYRVMSSIGLEGAIWASSVEFRPFKIEKP